MYSVAAACRITYGRSPFFPAYPCSAAGSVLHSAVRPSGIAVHLHRSHRTPVSWNYTHRVLKISLRHFFKNLFGFWFMLNFSPRRKHKHIKWLLVYWERTNQKDRTALCPSIIVMNGINTPSGSTFNLLFDQIKNLSYRHAGRCPSVRWCFHQYSDFRKHISKKSPKRDIIPWLYCITYLFGLQDFFHWHLYEDSTF